MAVRWKLITSILSFFLLLNLGVFLASRYTMFEGYLNVEQKLARDHIESVQNTLQDDLDNLTSINVDWSAWDDTYEYIVNKDPGYVESNLVISTFEELALNAIVLLDSEGQVVYSGGYDIDNESMSPLPEQLDLHLTPTSPLLKHPEPDSRVAGFLSLPQGAFLVSACPIIQSNMSGPINGTFIMGRFLGPEQLAGLARQTQLEISLVPVNGTANNLSVGAGSSLELISQELLEGTLPVLDVYGRNSFDLRIKIPREVSLQGRATLKTFFLWNLFVSFLAAILTYLLVDRWLSSRDERLESEERFRMMFFHSEAGCCMVSADGVIEQTNSAFCRMLGCHEADLVDQKLLHFINKIDRVWVASFFDKREGFNGTFNCRFTRKDGEPIWARGSLGWAGKYAILMLQDISAQKTLEDHLKLDLRTAINEEKETRAVLSSAVDGVLLVDRDNIVKYANRAAEKMLEMHSSYIVNREIGTLVDSDCLEKILDMVRQGDCSGKSCDVTIHRLSDENPSHLRFYAAPVESPDGRRDNVVISLHDLTSDFERDQLKNVSIATMAHEIRSPLTAVAGFSELLLEEDAVSHQDRQQIINYIYEKSQSLTGLIDDLLDMERITSGRKIKLNKVPVEINALLNKILWQHERTFDTHSFKTRFAEGDPVLNIDPRKIEQVIENLLSNAVKYSPVGHAILVTTKKLGHELRITVEDQGVGMTANELQRVFEKFYRSQATVDISDGMGLGLTIAKDIVEAHGGRIWLNSVYGEGTRVYVSLPCAEEQISSEHAN